MWITLFRSITAFPSESAASGCLPEKDVKPRPTVPKGSLHRPVSDSRLIPRQAEPSNPIRRVGRVVAVGVHNPQAIPEHADTFARAAVPVSHHRCVLRQPVPVHRVGRIPSAAPVAVYDPQADRKSTRLNSSHLG